MSDTTPTWRTERLEDRVQRLERRVDQNERHVDQNERRTSERITDVYSTIYWAMFILLIGLEVGTVIAAATNH